MSDKKRTVNIDNSSVQVKKEGYDVGIVGMWYGINYGSVMTAYALYKTVTDFGFKALMIQKPKELWNDHFYNEHTIANRFAKKHFVPSRIRKDYSEHTELNAICDTFLVGCDTLWHYPLTRTAPGFFFLDFVDDDKKKISYASSFGRGYDGPESARENVQRCLERFDSISTREKDGVKICKDLFNVDAAQVIDPVFLVTEDHYKSLSDVSSRDASTPYLLTYILDPNQDKKDAISRLCEVKGYGNLNIVDPNNEGSGAARLGLPVERGLSVEDWLKLFKNAEFIITDSYHGICFALIFRKKFICFGNVARGLARFTSLLSMLGLEDRICFSYIEMQKKEAELLKDIDYEKICALLADERQRCKGWLHDALIKKKKKTFTHTVVHALKDLGKCTGCGTCSIICPTAAMKMVADEYGFFRPFVDKEKCIDCGICEKHCIVLHPQYTNDITPQCYAMMADDSIRKISSSGGMFTVAAEYVLNHGGQVCGAAYTPDFEVEHIVINDASRLSELRGSKYMQSRSWPVYPRVKELLEQGKDVLFTGMPCQVAGLKAFLGKEYEHLYTIDLVCHGITSSAVFQKYHRDVLANKKLVTLEFKAKQPWGWHAGVNALFADGSKYSEPLESDPYFGAYLQSISKNIACGECMVNRLPRPGDLTIGDFWRIEEVDPALNDNKGTSLVLTNNKKGQTFLDLLKKTMAVIRQAPLNIASKGNGSIQKSYLLHKNSRLFFKYFSDIDFASLQSGCSNNRVYEKFYLELVKHLPKEEHEFFFIAKAAAENAKGRKIITWIRSARFESILQKFFGLTVAFGVSQRKEALVKGRIEDFSILNGKSSEYYLVSLDRAYDEAAYSQLESFGYRELKDFVFRRFKPIILENLDLSKGNYFDSYGNSIEGFNSVLGKVIIRGFNNHIMFGKNVVTARFLTFDLCANACIDIGENVKFDAPSQIESKGFEYGSSLKIGNDCAFNRGALFRFYTPSSAIIGDHCTASSQFALHVNLGKKAIIGRDCMFSFENELWAGDGHAIFDVKSGECTNRDMSETYRPSNYLVIGDHVWVGKQAFIMHGSNIGSGSIVGAGSIVKGVFPNNCSIVGNPAKKAKEDVAWSRDGMASDISKCGRQEYAVLTSLARAPISGRRVLVIGGTRFMGVQLVKELIARGNEVTIATRGRTKDKFGMAVNRLVLDVSDAESVKSALRGQYFDVVFDNLAYCSAYVYNILSNVQCGKYVQLSSIAAYVDRITDMKEELFNPYKLPVEMCDTSVSYGKGKRQAEAVTYQRFKEMSSSTVRIPYVTKTDRLYYYCKSVVKQLPMNIDDVSRGFTFIQDHEVGKFLPWLAAQDFSGPINLASEGMVTIQMILNYIEDKTSKRAVIDTSNGNKSPFNEKTFSLNMDKAKLLGYRTSNINDWFWKLMDEYIARALREA